MHRALNHLKLGPGELANSAMLLCFAVIVWLLSLPFVCRFWVHMLKIGLNNLPLRASLGVSGHRLSNFLYFEVPYLRIEPVLPSSQIWISTCIVTLLLLAISYMFSNKWTPITYLLRAVLIIQISALIYFAVVPGHFPHSPDSYMEGLITSGIGLISATPFLFAFTYYIFQISALKKISLTLFAMGYLIVFLPFQMLLQALVLQTTVLFMPILYVVFGMPLDVLLLIAIYSYGMTLPNNPPNNVLKTVQSDI